MGNSNNQNKPSQQAPNHHEGHRDAVRPETQRDGGRRNDGRASDHGEQRPAQGKDQADKTGR